MTSAPRAPGQPRPEARAGRPPLVHRPSVGNPGPRTRSPHDRACRARRARQPTNSPRGGLITKGRANENEVEPARRTCSRRDDRRRARGRRSGAQPVATSPVHAASIVVNTTQQGLGIPGCSLQEAILAANHDTSVVFYPDGIGPSFEHGLCRRQRRRRHRARRRCLPPHERDRRRRQRRPVPRRRRRSPRR